MPEKVVINVPSAPAAVGAYSQAVKFDDIIFVSGHIARDPKTGKLVGDDIAQQTEQCIKNISAILEAGGASLANVLKTTVYLTDIKHLPQMNQVYEQYFIYEPPARSVAEVSNLPDGALVQIEAVAYIKPPEVKGGLLY